MTDDKLSFTITLEDFLASHLGEDHCRTLNVKLAEILEVIASNQCICHIQWQDEYGIALEKPVVWRYKYWVESSDRWARSKAKSERERIERFIFEANTKIVSKKVKEFFQFDDDLSISEAQVMIRNNKIGLMKCIGVTKLITKESEL